MDGILVSENMKDFLDELECRYSANETMELLGHQSIRLLTTKEAHDVMDAWMGEIPVNAAFDYVSFAGNMLNLGYILGKREERARRRRNRSKNWYDILNMATEMVQPLTAMSDEDFTEMQAKLLSDAEQMPRVHAIMSTIFEVSERRRGNDR